MKKKIVLMVCLLSLLIAILPRFAAQLTAEEEEVFREPIYIRSDGSINPERAEALIQRSDNVYTLETNIIFEESDGFIIEKDSIVLDLNSHEISFRKITEAPGPSIGVTVIGPSNITVKNSMNVSGFQYGIYLRGSNNITIFNNTALYNDIGIYTQDSSYVLLDRNVLLENIEEGVYLWHSSNHTIVDNVVSNKHMCGILMFDSDNNEVVQNTVSNNTRGIEIRFSRDNAVLNNNVSNNAEPGICITDKSFKNTITLNTVYNNSRAGIYLEDSNETDVLNNNVTKNIGNGVELQGSCYNTISGNYASNNIVGINLTANSNENDVFANTLTLNSQAGISLHLSANNAIDGNTVSNNFDGVLLQGCDDNKIRENRIFNSDHGHGIILQEHSGDIKSNNIIGNFIFNSSFGISIANSSGNSVERNDIMHSLWNGIELSDSRGNYVVGNHIEDSDQFGIFLLKSSDNTIRSNTVVNAKRVGINVTDSSYNKIYYNNFIENAQQVDGNTLAENEWDDGGLYPCPICESPEKRHKGNYWSDYVGSDDGSQTQVHNCPCDGIGDTDTPYQGVDHYPLMAPWIPIQGDINLDGTVDIFDIVTAAINFGKTT